MSSSLLHVSVVLIAALVVSCTSSPTNNHDHHQHSHCGPLNLSFSKMALFNEDPCVKEGGQCLEEGLCPEGKLASRGLCPEQQKRGVECCNGVSLDVKDCRGQGGDCTSTSTSTDCPANLRVLADDCDNYEVCCVRV